MENSIETLAFRALGYAYNALEPFIDAQTMELHHSKHHQTYYNNMMKSAAENGAESLSLEQLFKKISDYPMFLRNNAGGHYNHELFWSILKLNGGEGPHGNLSEAISKDFGSFAGFKEQFSQAALTRFGSGWAWLSRDAGGKLFISSTANQDNPLMDVTPEKGLPILGLDVWEHAYYLKYQNRRPEYIDAFWHVVNWTEAEKRFNRI
jgi:superoxide dismutase, Fe-Mn family